MTNRYTVGEDTNITYVKFVVIDGDSGYYMRIGPRPELAHQLARCFNGEGIDLWRATDYDWYNWDGHVVVRAVLNYDEDYEDEQDEDWSDDG